MMLYYRDMKRSRYLKDQEVNIGVHYHDINLSINKFIREPCDSGNLFTKNCTFNRRRKFDVRFFFYKDFGYSQNFVRVTLRQKQS